LTCLGNGGTVPIAAVMGETSVFWRRKKDRISQFRSVALPGEVGHVSVPADFVVEMEDDSTLMAYPRGEETVTLRFSSISVVVKGRDERAGATFVRQSANEHGHSYTEIADKGVASYEEDSERDGVPLVVCFWEVGCKNTVVIVSATIPKKQRQHRTVRETLEAMPAILRSLEVTKIHQVIESDAGEVEFTIETADPMPQSVRPFGQDEEDWLAASLHHAAALGARYGSGGELGPEELDCVFSRWMSEEGEKEPSDLVANALGAALGAYLVEHRGFRWILLTDKWGSEYAVRHPVGETTAFPRASVVKRIEAGQSECFQHLYLAILEQLERSEADRPESE
jgi:hypothetical protein